MATANSTGAPAPDQPLSDRIDRHLNGERVTTEYINLKTGQAVQVPMDEDPPEGCIPVLGEVNAGPPSSPHKARWDRTSRLCRCPGRRRPGSSTPLPYQ